MSLVKFGSVLLDLLKGIVELFGLLLDSLANGIAFFITIMSKIPTFIFELFNSLPGFIRIGLSGALGIMIFIVIIKVIVLIRESTV